ncbi:MAG: hypothetical protein K0R61_4378, partial [Microvirga sp.]|nr:hypothetical protein [Microvirga sp.]
MLRILQPVGTIGDEGPGPDLGDAVGEGIDIPIGPIHSGQMAGKPVGRDGPVLHEETVELTDKIRVGLRRNFSVIRHLADLPEPLHGVLRPSHGLDVVFTDQNLEGEDVLSRGSPHEPMLPRLAPERLAQARQRGEIEIRVAPLQDAHRVENVVFQRLDGFRIEGRAATGGAEGPVAHIAAGTAGDLGEFRVVQLAEL